MLRCYMYFGLLMLTSKSFLYGQGSAQRPAFPREGKAVLKLLPVNPGDSLGQVVVGSELIVDGIVLSSQPQIPRSVSSRQAIVETHAIVSVGAVLKGTLPKGSMNILLAQTGGRSRNWETEVEGDTLLAEGSRYILFLQSDNNRPEVANTSGIRRYAVVGIWAGKAMILDGRVRFLPSVSSGLAKYNRLDSFSFSQEIKDLVAGRYIPPKSPPTSPLPPHPSPPSGRRQ